MFFKLKEGVGKRGRLWNCWLLLFVGFVNRVLGIGGCDSDSLSDLWLVSFRLGVICSSVAVFG